ncbi:MAG: CRISPR-associated endonuclease Cas1 [Saprospiraceae bacterium]|nr:CRISPR-associated endonuclease Cas1 [Saprospiraceae bacterium]
MKRRKRIKKGAEDLFNSSLNYCYGILYGMIEASLLMKGLDPYMGVFHVNRHNKATLAFDHIEPFRPWADKVVIGIIKKMNEIEKAEALVPDELDMKFLLTLEYRKKLIEAFFSMMDERAYLQGMRIKRKDHIHNLSGSLVEVIKKFMPNDIEIGNI